MPRLTRSPSSETRARWTRAGGRDLTVNDPAWMGTIRIPQPADAGWANPGFVWAGSDAAHFYERPRGLAALPTVNRALGLIADSLSSMPWHTFKGRDRTDEPPWLADPQNRQGDRRIAPLLLFDAMPVVAFRAQMMTSLVMHGEAFLYAPDLDPFGYPRAPVFLLNPEDVDKRDGAWWVSQDRLDPRRVLHVLGRAPYTSDGRGLGVIARHTEALGMAEAVRRYVSGAYTAGIPAGYLKVTGPQMTQDDADRLKRRWMEAHGGDRRSIAVLSSTTEFHPLSWKLSDMAVLEMGAFSDKDVAHAFGMSAHYLDVPGDSSTYANVQDRAIDFRTFTLLPWARLVESALESWLPYGHTLKIRMEGLERANLASRDASYQSRVGLGAMTVDEVRELEDLPPLPQEAPAPESFKEIVARLNAAEQEEVQP